MIGRNAPRRVRGHGPGSSFEREPKHELHRLAPPGSTRRRVAQRLLGVGQPPILVASMSRAGSTVLFRSVRRGWTESRFGANAERLAPLIGEHLWRIENARLVPGVVYKTHDLPAAALCEARPKVLFTYRKATDVALSIALKRAVEGPDWFSMHEEHMGAKGGYEEFLRRDTLGLERQIDGWFTAEGLDLLGLHYDSIWERRAEIEDFLGFPIPLPKRVATSHAGVPAEDAALIRATYSPLDRKIETLPDMFLRQTGRPLAA